MKSTRQMKIVSMLERNKVVNTAALASHFNVSIETIRRDLDYLEKQYVLKKIYGGAELIAKDSDNIPSLVTRSNKCLNEKNAIAAKAAEFIPDGCMLAIDAGSTIRALCPYLNKKSDITVICCDIFNAAQLLPNNRIYMMGGFLTSDGTSTGTHAKEFFSTINDMDLFVFSTDGINPQWGITNDDTQINDLKKRCINKARTKILLADHSKFNSKGFYKTCDFSDIDVMITDSGTAPEIIEHVRQFCRVEIAEVITNDQL